MEYIHVKSLDKFHPGYKDRDLHWAKISFRMVQGDPDCEMIGNEIDWGRLIKFILLELQAKKPIPLNEGYLTRKGFDLEKRPISLTLKMLHNFLSIVSEDSISCVLDKKREDIREGSVTEENKAVSRDILAYLNLKAKKKFLFTNKEALKLINGRLNEGRTLEDFKHVIDVKCQEWLGQPMAKYLRPATLFNPTKFECYINQDKEQTSDDLEEMEDLV